MFAPAFHGDPGTTSLKYDSDFFISKPTTDILLHGHAYAPNGQAVAQVDVGMRIGSLNQDPPCHGQPGIPAYGPALTWRAGTVRSPADHLRAGAGRP